MTERLTLEFDGGSRGNPGPAGIGIVIRSEDGTALVTLGRFIGHATNNVAEYRALIEALKKATELGEKNHYSRRQRTGHQADAWRIPRQAPRLAPAV